MRAFYLFLTLVCAVQALRVPFLQVSRIQLSPSQRSSSSSVSEGRSCQICGSGTMTRCSCAACSSSRSQSSSRIARRQQRLHMSTSGSTTTEPSPGSPVIKNIDKTTNVATMVVALSGAQTQSAFAKSCELFNEEVKERGYKVAGFRQGAKLPPAYLYQMFGEDKVKLLCGNLLSEEIQDECEKTGMMFVGRGRIMQFNEDTFTAGKPHTIEIECDLWPEISYGAAGYKNMEVTVNASPIDMEKYEQVKQNIRERYKELTDTPAGKAAEMGDVLIANMKGYDRMPDGSKGDQLPAVAGGDGVEILLEKGKFMEGMIEALVGCKAGETKMVPVTFPIRPSGPGATLSGKEALFQVEVTAVKIKTIPVWDEKLANRVRDGMTLKALEQEIVTAVEGDSKNNRETALNDALAAKLLEITTLSQIPESLVDETTQMRFQQMLYEFKEQGSTQEQLAEMTTPEKYNKYKEISRVNVNKIVTLGMAFRDIAEKENVVVTPAEVREQLDVINVQSKQKGEEPVDEARAKDEIENTMLRKKVFEILAKNAKVTWIEAAPVGDQAQA